jgi:hypothetical protein
LTDPDRIDPQRLAALIEGRLSQHEAAAVRRQLAVADDDAITAFADAVVVTGQLGTADRPHRSWIRASRLFLLASAAVLVVAVAFAWNRARGDGYLPTTYVATISGGAAPDGGVAWSAFRGGTTALSDRAAGVRVGALLVDLEWRARHRDSTNVALLELAHVLAGVSGGRELSDSVGALPVSSIASVPSARAQAFGHRAIGLVDRDAAGAGAYLEAARIATAGGDVEFFTMQSSSVVANAMKSAPNDSAATQAFGRFNARLGDQPRDAATLHRATTELLAILAKP